MAGLGQQHGTVATTAHRFCTAATVLLCSRRMLLIPAHDAARQKLQDGAGACLQVLPDSVSSMGRSLSTTTSFPQVGDDFHGDDNAQDICVSMGGVIRK